MEQSIEGIDVSGDVNKTAPMASKPSFAGQWCADYTSMYPNLRVLGTWLSPSLQSRTDLTTTGIRGLLALSHRTR